jgi:hypothetical protein
MPALKIGDPLWRPGDIVIDRLNVAVANEISTGKAGVFSRGERHRLSEMLAMDAAMAMLRPVRRLMTVIDDLRRNMPGYDILVGDRLRIQVKGGTYVDSIGWTHTAGLPEAKDLQLDIEVVVDIGVVLNPRPFGPRRDGRDQIPLQPHVDFYIIPGDVVRAQVATGARVNRAGAHLYLYKQRLRPGTKEHERQWLGLAEWRNRFDVIEVAVRSLLDGGHQSPGACAGIAF